MGNLPNNPPPFPPFPETLHSQVINLLLDAPDIATFQQELKALLDGAENGN